MILEPRWKSLIATTRNPIFTPEQCQEIISIGHQQKTQEAKIGHKIGYKEKKGGTYDTKTRVVTISWIPFIKMPDMYQKIDHSMRRTNGNHFGYEGMQITELAQFSEYSKGGFYDWHIDVEVSCENEPPVRKISMTILLSPQTEFEGGDLEFMTEGNKPISLVQGQAIYFCSLLRHRVTQIKKGIRRALVMWFGGPPLK